MRPIILAALLALSPLTEARTITGIHLAETLPPSNGQPALRLNGAALRSMPFLPDAYIGLLYVENPSQNASSLIHQDARKRVVFHILTARLSGRRIAAAMYDAILLNLSEQEVISLSARLDRLIALFDNKMERGDVIYVEYIPGQGSNVVIRGEGKGTIPGKDLFDALMKIWIGEYPVDPQFKREILGQESRQEQAITID